MAHSGQGYVAASIGSVIGMIGGIVSTVPLFERASDHPNGWWHDPDGALVFVGAGVVLGAIGLGTAIALRVAGHRRSVLTGVVTIVFTVPILAVAFMLHPPPITSYLVPMVAAAIARLATATAPPPEPTNLP